VIRALAAAILALWALPAAAKPVPADEVRQTLIEVADSIGGSVLDAQGRARGDYSWQAGEWSEYEAAWHVGQAIEGLLAAHEATGDARFLAKAKVAGDYWAGLEIKQGPLKGMINAAHGDRLGPLINFTTVGNGTPGLFRLSRVTGDPRYADVASRAIVWLARNMAVPGHPGLYYNIVDPATGQIWTDKSPHHEVAKASVTQVARPNIEGSPFLDACLHLRAAWLCEAQIDLARRTAARQSPDGLWMEFEPNNPDTGGVHPRFNSWNAEALLRTYGYHADPALLAAALATARANGRMMRADGSFDYVQNRDGSSGRESPTGSATAFAGLLWLELRALGHREFDAQIHAAARWIIANRFAADHPDPNVRGLVVEFRVKRDASGRRVLLLRDLGSPFAARFLAAYLAAFPDAAP
jgi:hypothetical protein